MGRFLFVSFGLLVVFLPLSGTEAGFDCPSDWSSYRQYCYKFFQQEMTWEAAERFCSEQAEGGHLVSIESDGEAAFVAELVPENIKATKYYVWIGLRIQGQEQQCSTKWSDGSSISYENLVKQATKKCFVLKEEAGVRKWVNVYCGKKYVFTCKFLRPR
uniref:C-type lectin 2 n=1 Tax=Sistrurus miliarius barbouri TaxID=8759 RepID=A0A194AS88_SISMB